MSRRKAERDSKYEWRFQEKGKSEGMRAETRKEKVTRSQGGEIRSAAEPRESKR